MNLLTRAYAEKRTLTAAALLGSTVGLALGAAYMAGGLAREASDHSRATRLAAAAAEGFSETALQGAAARMDSGVLRVARRHDPFTVAGADERDRQSAIFAARLEKTAHTPAQTLLLRTSLPNVSPAAPFRHEGAIEASRELECLTQAVYYEARGETPAGQAAVAQVVLNRVRHPAFPKTVCGVVFQGAGSRGCQFSFACNGAMRKGYEIRAWTRAQRIAGRALSGDVMEQVGNATHFHTTGVSPAWGARLTRVGQVGVHIFYRFGRGGFHAAPRSVAQPEETSEPVYAAPSPGPTDLKSNDLRLTSLVLDADTAAAISVASAASPAAAKASAGVKPAAQPGLKPTAQPGAKPQAGTEAKAGVQTGAKPAAGAETARLTTQPGMAAPTGDTVAADS